MMTPGIDEAEKAFDLESIPAGYCTTCGKSHRELAESGTFPKHSFNDGTLGASATFGKKLPDGSRTPPGNQPVTIVQEAPWPFDPVLRQALIDKGVITPEDLKSAEEKIRAVTAQFAASGGVPA